MHVSENKIQQQTDDGESHRSDNCSDKVVLHFKLLFIIVKIGTFLFISKDSARRRRDENDRLSIKASSMTKFDGFLY